MLEILNKLKALVAERAGERAFQSLIKLNLHVVGKCFGYPSDEYIAFSEFPFGDGTCDFVVFTDRSRMSVVAIEVKGAEFAFSTEAGLIAAEINHAAKQVRDRFSHIDGNREGFRRWAHELRRRVEGGEIAYNSVIGPHGSLLVDPLKDITWRGVVIGGYARDDAYESRERSKLELNASPHIRYESWDSLIRKLEPREPNPLQELVKSLQELWNERQGPPITLGTRVKTKAAWAGVPAGTEGVVDEHYQGMNGIGVMVAWDLPERPLPIGYECHNPSHPIRGLLRDGFSPFEVESLEVVEKS
ncbi:Shedu anti-phage system protein SduA domain-containing protein [Comamonas testosteroni]|uniref:Shedu anti-phage system protein SduA domain-containing protein n=1 Tax=Comamonas testosteroni TaxID=285 RepID=UPI00389A591E